MQAYRYCYFFVWSGFFLRGAAMGSEFFAFWWCCMDDKRKFSFDGLLFRNFLFKRSFYIVLCGE